MKVLRIVHSMDPAYGGPCQGIRNSIPELEKIGVNNEVVSLDLPGSIFHQEDSFPIHKLGAGNESWSYSPQLFQWLLENLGRFDAVIIHGLWRYYSFATYRAVNRLRKIEIKDKLPKIFVMPHGMLDPYFQTAPSRRIKAIRNAIYWKLVERKVINNADGLLFTCQEELNLARKTFKEYYPKMELNVGYGILAPPSFDNSMEIAFRQNCKSLNNKYLLYLSRINEKKGLDMLVEAYKSLYHIRKDIPNLVVAGPGLDSEFGQQIINNVDTSNLSHKIHMVGMLSGDEKWGAFYGCDAFILPSHQENFGISVVEAMACGKPVLISDQVNIHREISAGNGGIVKVDTIEGVTELLDTWLNLSDEEQSLMGSNAKAVYDKHYTIKQAAFKLKEALFN